MQEMVSLGFAAKGQPLPSLSPGTQPARRPARLPPVPCEGVRDRHQGPMFGRSLPTPLPPPRGIALPARRVPEMQAPQRPEIRVALRAPAWSLPVHLSSRERASGVLPSGSAGLAAAAGLTSGGRGPGQTGRARQLPTIRSRRPRPPPTCPEAPPPPRSSTVGAGQRGLVGAVGSCPGPSRAGVKGSTGGAQPEG